MGQNRFCSRCQQTMDESNFYSSYNTEKYPSGKLNLCKKCLTTFMNPMEPDTFVWALQEIDVPYIPNKWNDVILKEKAKGKTEPIIIFGRYLSSLKLRPYDKYRWADTEYLQQLEKEKIENAMRKQGYSASEIEQTIATGIKPLPSSIEMPDFKKLDAEKAQKDEEEQRRIDEANAEDFFGGSGDDASLNLTEEDKTYLRLKWGRAYKQYEWVALEQLYEEMMNSYDIQQAGDINTLKLMCKASLKANQLMDMGDIEGAQKTTKMYNDLMKSGKWTAAQNKAEKEDEIDSIGELVAICERQGFIPKYYVDSPQDKIDRVLEDMQKYTHDLVANETNLGLLIEKAGKQMAEEEARIAEAAANGNDDDDEDEEEKLFDYSQKVVQDEDFYELNDFIESEREQDQKEVED